MASRGFYLVSAALLGGTALVLWLAVSRGADAPESAPDVALADAQADDRAVGVRAVDYDSAAVRASWEAPADVLAARTGAPRIEPAPPPPPPTPEELVPAPPPPVDPALNAAAEASAAVQPKVIAAVRADLERRRNELRKSCWPPGSDVAATFTFQASYAADGTLVTLGVPDVPGMSGVGSCLMGQVARKPPALPEPPGVAVELAVPIAFAGSETLPTPPPPTDLVPGE